MQIRVHGKQIQLGEALTEHVETQLPAIVGKYFDHAVDATVTFSRDAGDVHCDTMVHLPGGHLAHGSFAAKDSYASFGQASDHLEKQLRRHKRRLRDHHRNGKSPVDVQAAPAYVHAAPAVAEEAEDQGGDQGLIIADTGAKLPSYNVSQAVEEMERGSKGFLVFRNDAQDRINVVFRRDDGNVGWIDPVEASGTAAKGN